MATPDPARVWADHFPRPTEHMASAGTGLLPRRRPAKPVVYEDFLPASAAGIFRSNLDYDAQRPQARKTAPDYDSRLDGRRHRPHIHDPYDLYEKVAAS